MLPCDKYSCYIGAWKVGVTVQIILGFLAAGMRLTGRQHKGWRFDFGKSAMGFWFEVRGSQIGSNKTVIHEVAWHMLGRSCDIVFAYRVLHI